MGSEKRQIEDREVTEVELTRRVGCQMKLRIFSFRRLCIYVDEKGIRAIKNSSVEFYVEYLIFLNF